MRACWERRRRPGSLSERKQETGIRIMTFIRTVIGDIAPEALGRCYAHEHVIIDPSYTTQLFPEILLPSVENAVCELSHFKAAGGGAMVDCMPCDAGRNVEKLAEVSRR